MNDDEVQDKIEDELWRHKKFTAEVLQAQIGKIALRCFNLYGTLRQAVPEQIIAAKYRVSGNYYTFLDPIVFDDRIVFREIARRSRGDVARITATDVEGAG